MAVDESDYIIHQLVCRMVYVNYRPATQAGWPRQSNGFDYPDLCAKIGIYVKVHKDMVNSNLLINITINL